MIWGTHGAARDLSRLREISSVLIRHGLGDLVRRTGLASALGRAGQILHWSEAGKSAEIEPQERFRRSLVNRRRRLTPDRRAILTPIWPGCWAAEPSAVERSGTELGSAASVFFRRGTREPGGVAM
jgi:hypothetical protein